MSQSRRTRKTKATALLGVGTMLVGGGIAASLAPGTSTASSHREAPAIAGQPAYDNTDVYAFAQADGKVNLIANWAPFSEPGGGPNFYPWADDAEYLIVDGGALAHSPATCGSIGLRVRNTWSGRPLATISA